MVRLAHRRSTLASGRSCCRSEISGRDAIARGPTVVEQKSHELRHRNVDKGGRTRLRSAQPAANWIRTEVPELRIVSDELWTAVQQRRRPAARGRAAVTGCLSSSLLSGFATCALCDGPLTIAGSRKRDHCYGCSRHRNRGRCAQTTCSSRSRASTAGSSKRSSEPCSRPPRGASCWTAPRKPSRDGSVGPAVDTSTARVSRRWPSHGMDRGDLTLGVGDPPSRIKLRHCPFEAFGGVRGARSRATRTSRRPLADVYFQWTT